METLKQLHHALEFAMSQPRAYVKQGPKASAAELRQIEKEMDEFQTHMDAMRKAEGR
jgi:hypothetical protein